MGQISAVYNGDLALALRLGPAHLRSHCASFLSLLRQPGPSLSLLAPLPRSPKNRLRGYGHVEIHLSLRIRRFREKRFRSTYRLSVRFILELGKSQTEVYWIWPTSRFALAIFLYAHDTPAVLTSKSLPSLCQRFVLVSERLCPFVDL